MAYSFVQEKYNSVSASGTTVAVTMDVNVGADGVLWVAATGQKFTMTIADTLGLTWVDMGSSQEAAIDQKLQHWYAKTGSGGATTITVTYSTTSERRGIYALEIGGLDVTTPNDGSSEVTDTGENPTANAAITPSVQPAVMVSCCFGLQGVTSANFYAGTGMTHRAEVWSLTGRGVIQYKAVTSTSQQTSNCVNSTLARNMQVAAMFTEATGGGGGGATHPGWVGGGWF